MRGEGSEQLPNDSSGPWTRPSFVIAAAIVGLLAVLAIVLALSGGHDDKAAEARRPPPTTTQATPAKPASGGCSVPDGDQTVPTAAPTDTKWELVGNMIAPTAPRTYGPGRVRDGIRECFAHSPIGALYASMNFWAALTSQPSPEVYRRLAVPSKARDAAVAADASDGTDTLGGLQVAAFSFAKYAHQGGTVRLAFRVQSGGLFEVDTTLVWREDDWRIEVPLDQNPVRGQLQDLSGFIAWDGSGE